jgi:hypothetical protein
VRYDESILSKTVAVAGQSARIQKTISYNTELLESVDGEVTRQSKATEIVARRVDETYDVVASLQKQLAEQQQLLVL